ncbi:Astacin-like peptidase p16 [Argiope bruennichi]|uniref:Astacin-like peptidase p16 n=1 Tax=Argiope bruennichi TaxID=94029 RepID=A0A8T0FFL0_ARGBR|nr:Astacin-like peptidase p16 [Argiope bruennichi]
MTNVKKGFEGNFNKIKPSEELRYTTYDYNSIMQYGEYAFSRAPKILKTMVAKDGTPLKEPYEKPGLTAKDMDVINKMYQYVAFLAVLLNMTGSFRGAYMIAFPQDGLRRDFLSASGLLVEEMGGGGGESLAQMGTLVQPGVERWENPSVVLQTGKCALVRVQQIPKEPLLNDVYRILNHYGKATNVLTVLDVKFSYLAFLTVFVSMGGSFRGAYMFCIHGEFLSMACLTIYYVSILLVFIISAALANEAKNEAKRAFQCLKHRTSALCKDIRSKIKEICKADSSLTLWRFYIVEISMLITCLGTLLTYGILLATLGK